MSFPKTQMKTYIVYQHTLDLQPNPGLINQCGRVLTYYFINYSKIDLALVSAIHLMVYLLYLFITSFLKIYLQYPLNEIT